MATSNGVAQPVPPPEAIAAMQDRLVQTGEWTRMLRALQRKLNEAGWTDQLRIHAREKAQGSDSLTLAALVQEITPYARDTIPGKVKEDVTEKMKTWLDANVE